MIYLKRTVDSYQKYAFIYSELTEFKMHEITSTDFRNDSIKYLLSKATYFVLYTKAKYNNFSQHLVVNSIHYRNYNHSVFLRWIY